MATQGTVKTSELLKKLCDDLVLFERANNRQLNECFGFTYDLSAKENWGVGIHMTLTDLIGNE